MNALRTNFFKSLPCLRFSGVSVSFAIAFAIALFGVPHPAFAAVSLGEVMCTVADNMAPFLDVFNMVAYIAGAIFIIQGLLHWRNHHEHGYHQYPHHKTFALITGGVLLMALPSVMGTLIDTLFGWGAGGDDGATIGACVDMMPQTSTTSSGAPALDTMLTNLVNNIQFPLTVLTSIVAILLGLFLIIRGLMKASRYGNDPRAHSIANILTNLVIGTVLVVIGQSVGVIMESVLGQGSSTLSDFSSLSWTSFAGLGDSTQFQNAIKAALTFFQLIGLISFVRGWNIIRHAVEGSGQATVPQGITHIVGGVLAINIYMFVKIIDTTLGTSFFS